MASRDEAMRAAAEVHRDAPWAEQPHTWATAGADAELARACDYLETELPRSVPTMDPPYTAAFNAGIDYAARSLRARAHWPKEVG